MYTSPKLHILLNSTLLARFRYNLASSQIGTRPLWLSPDAMNGELVIWITTDLLTRIESRATAEIDPHLRVRKTDLDYVMGWQSFPAKKKKKGKKKKKMSKEVRGRNRGF